MKTRLTFLAALLLGATTAHATMLPKFAPVPTPRPAQVETAAENTVGTAVKRARRINSGPVVTREPMPIPEMRRDVRMIGPSFMPDPEHDLDIHAIDAARVDPVNTVVRYVASYLGDDDQPVTTASADAGRWWGSRARHWSTSITSSAGRSPRTLATDGAGEETLAKSIPSGHSDPKGSTPASLSGRD